MPRPARPAWFPDWSGAVAALVASGTSATPEAVALLRRPGVRVLVVNTCYQLAPWADALYACDSVWWHWYPDALRFAGLKITQDEPTARTLNIHQVELLPPDAPDADTIQVARPGVLGRGSNGGFQALNLEVQFGARRIILIGLDYHGPRWHGAHRHGVKEGQHPATLAHWAKLFDAQADRLAELGVEIINASPHSALNAFRKLPIEPALAAFGVR
jgi:hypothetical protein